MTTVRNPQGNSTVERMHQTLGNMLRAIDIDNWTIAVQTTAFALRAAHNRVLNALPTQIVFGRDLIVNVPAKNSLEERAK